MLVGNAVVVVVGCIVLLTSRASLFSIWRIWALLLAPNRERWGVGPSFRGSLSPDSSLF